MNAGAGADADAFEAVMAVGKGYLGHHSGYRIWSASVDRGVLRIHAGFTHPGSDGTGLFFEHDGKVYFRKGVRAEVEILVQNTGGLLFESVTRSAFDDAASLVRFVQEWLREGGMRLDLLDAMRNS